MDFERPRTSGRTTMERPATQWRRDDEIGLTDSKNDRPSTMTGRPQTRIERPVSRRGTQNDLSRDANIYRSVTPSKSGLARPSSASVNSNRGSTANPRLNTMASAMGIKRINTGLPPTSQVNYNMMDRPITQQGIAGIRPGTTRGPMSRQIQDKRYYEGLIQVKIRELTQEIGIITREIDSQNRERATFIHYDNRAKELATELTDLQGKLADFNIVIDKSTSNIDKETIEQEVTELREFNDKASTEVDRLYEQRRSKEQQLCDMEERIQSEKKKEERIIESMSPEIREKYDKLINQRNELENDISTMQKEIDNMSNEKISLEEQIALSQVKQEVVKLKLKITEVEEKREKLKEERKNKLSPDEERERLLAKVKQDNMDIVAAERRTEDAKKHINEFEQELEQLETEMDENHSEKQVKYNELRKREEAIELFMPSFDQNKIDELEKIENLEENIVEKLQKLSFAIDQDAGQLTDEMAILNFSSNDQSQEADKSFEGLSKEHVRLQHVMMKMLALEKKLNGELIEINEKTNKKENELLVLEDLDGLKTRTDEKYKELIKRKEELKIRYPNCEKELSIIKKEYESLKNELNKNDTYLQITALEEKFDKLKENNNIIQKLITEGRDSVNYQPLREKTFTLVAEYNVFLQQNTKNIY